MKFIVSLIIVTTALSASASTQSVDPTADAANTLNQYMTGQIDAAGAAQQLLNPSSLFKQKIQVVRTIVATQKIGDKEKLQVYELQDAINSKVIEHNKQVAKNRARAYGAGAVVGAAAGVAVGTYQANRVGGGDWKILEEIMVFARDTVIGTAAGTVVGGVGQTLLGPSQFDAQKVIDKK